MPGIAQLHVRATEAPTLASGCGASWGRGLRAARARSHRLLARLPLLSGQPSPYSSFPISTTSASDFPPERGSRASRYGHSSREIIAPSCPRRIQPFAMHFCLFAAAGALPSRSFRSHPLRRLGWYSSLLTLASMGDRACRDGTMRSQRGVELYTSRPAWMTDPS